MTATDSLEFAGLQPDQNQFLAHRLRSRSDREAAASAHIAIGRIEAWKQRDQAFMRAYRELGSDGVKLAQRITREDLGMAAIVLREGLTATRLIVVSKRDIREVPDWKSRHEAAELILKIHGVLTAKIDIEIRVRQIAAQLGLDPDEAVAEAQRVLRDAATV